jgi:Fe-S-cluster-containing dehydrogenase component
MEITRRSAIQKIATGTAAAVATGCVSSVALSGVADAAEPKQAPEHAVSMLYDTTRCIGCKSCVAACAEANKMERDPRNPLYLAPVDLNSFTKNIIKLYKPSETGPYSYVKSQCMHCIDPACVAGCTFHGLSKDASTGIVSWTAKMCIGCRYCEISCPYGIPKFQWDGYNPKIVKCEFCKPRLAKGEGPACTSVCPTHAVVYGTRDQLLAEAKKRLADHPNKYYENRVFGEKDGGGTQVLYLSHVPFEKIGLPNLGEESIPSKYLKWQKRLYQYLAVPVVLYASIVGVVRGNFKRHQDHMRQDEEKTGLRAQL